jgi:hypothetical protein
VPYKQARPAVDGDRQAHDLPLPERVAMVREIVSIEGPIHVDQIARRVARAFRRRKVSQPMAEAVRGALEHVYGGDLQTDGTFWYTPAQAATSVVCNRSREKGETRKALSISPLEIRAALHLARAEQGEADPEADASTLIEVVAKLLGVPVDDELQSRMAQVLQELPDSCL